MLVTVTSCAAGSTVPWGAVKDKLAGATASAGGGGSIVNVTATVLGEPSAPGALTVTFVVYVPAVSPASDGVTVSVPPDPETLSHETFSDAVQARPPAETSTVLAAGLAPPCVPVNDRLDGDTVSGGAGRTDR